MEQIINESDTNEKKIAAAAALNGSPEPLSADSNPSTGKPASESIALFDVAGAVNPSQATEGATMPPRIETRGRHKLGCTCDKCKAKGKTATAKKGKAEKADDAVPDHIQAAILYNFILTRGCKLISPEYEQGRTVAGGDFESSNGIFRIARHQAAPLGRSCCGDSGELGGGDQHPDR